MFLGCAGLVLLGVVAAIGTSGMWSSYVLAVAAGLVVAAVGFLSTRGPDRSVLQAALIGAALAGALLARPLDQYRREAQYFGDYTPIGTPPDWQLVIGASVTLMLFFALWFTTPAGPDGDAVGTSAAGRTFALGIAIPITALVLWWWFVATRIIGDLTIGEMTWPYGVLLVPLVIGGVLWLPGRAGLVLVAMLATVAAEATLPNWFGSWPMLLVFVVLIMGGIVTGRRWPHPVSGMGVLLVCVLVNFTDQSPWDVAGIVAAFVVPAVGGHVVAACLPTTAGVGTMAVTSPATLYSVAGISFGWVAYSPGRPSGFDSFTPSTTALALSVTTIIACATTTALIIRRRPLPTLEVESAL